MSCRPCWTTGSDNHKFLGSLGYYIIFDGAAEVSPHSRTWSELPAASQTGEIHQSFPVFLLQLLLSVSGPTVSETKEITGKKKKEAKNLLYNIFHQQRASLCWRFKWNITLSGNKIFYCLTFTKNIVLYQQKNIFPNIISQFLTIDDQ